MVESATCTNDERQTILDAIDLWQKLVYVALALTIVNVVIW